MRKLFTVTMLVMTFAVFQVTISAAGVKKVKPSELKLSNSTYTYIQTTAGVSSANPDAHAKFYAEVKLPLGKVVKKVTYYHMGLGYAPVSTWVALYRSKFGGLTEMMAYGSHDSFYSTPIEVLDDTIDFAKVKSGYSYWVEVYSENSASLIQGIEITYK